MDETGCNKSPVPLFFQKLSNTSDSRTESSNSVITTSINTSAVHEQAGNKKSLKLILSELSGPESSKKHDIEKSVFNPGKENKKNADKIQCLLCPHNCIIAPDNFGMCLVRGNKNGQASIPFYGRLSALALDPIEKKPLYHFYPGSSIMSAGFFGCNLKCPFCQNSSISSRTDLSYRSYSPEEILLLLKKQGGIGLAYTYSEPSIHIEWIGETAELLRKNGYKNVLVTNGMINEGPADFLLKNIDAANIDLKSHNPDFYRNELKGDLDTVKNFIEKAASKIHVEVTTLVIPGRNDSEKEIMENAKFLASININTPYHLSCYFPSFKYKIPPTPVHRVLELAAAARDKLNFVYTGNTGIHGSDTICPSCGEVLIKRTGYSAHTVNLDNNKCINCSYDSGIIA